MIRLALPGDLPALPEIERAAGEPFRSLGMSSIADDEPPSVAELAVPQRDGRLWVHLGDGERPVAYLRAEIIDGDAHIEQVSVHPSHAHRRIGSALIDTLDGWAASRGLAGLSLTTFAEVPWNAPYYARLGFQPLDEAELADGLRAIREHEKVLGLDAWPRLCMRRPGTGS